VLADAQRLGFAEADPSFDVDGIDAAHKLSILASLAFGARVDFPHVACEGIRAVESADIDHAAALGFRIKLIGLAAAEGGALFQRVHPCLVSLKHAAGACRWLAQRRGGGGRFRRTPAVPGARCRGEGPTASAVVADLIDVARGEAARRSSMPGAPVEAAARRPACARSGAYYMRLTVADRPGVIAETSPRRCAMPASRSKA
jgi:homoserine dehydrogenase